MLYAYDNDIKIKDIKYLTEFLNRGNSNVTDTVIDLILWSFVQQDQPVVIWQRFYVQRALWWKFISVLTVSDC